MTNKSYGAAAVFAIAGTVVAALAANTASLLPESTPAGNVCRIDANGVPKLFKDGEPYGQTFLKDAANSSFGHEGLYGKDSDISVANREQGGFCVLKTITGGREFFTLILDR